MSTFRFRAECMHDVTALLRRISVKRVEVVLLEEGLPDVEATVEEPWQYRKLDLEGLRDVCREVEDGHVMVETLAPIAKYTGERKLDVARLPDWNKAPPEIRRDVERMVKRHARRQ